MLVTCLHKVMQHAGICSDLGVTAAAVLLVLNVSEPATRDLFQRRDNRPRLITRFSDDDDDVLETSVALLPTDGVATLHADSHKLHHHIAALFGFSAFYNKSKAHGNAAAVQKHQQKLNDHGPTGPINQSNKLYYRAPKSCPDSWPTLSAARRNN